MKQPLNPATHFAMLLMALAMAFTFLACEEKGKKAEPVTEADCLDKSGALHTAEATFLSFKDAHDLWIDFRLADGEEKRLRVASNYYDSVSAVVKGLQNGDKVSITYQQKQFYFSDTACVREKILISVTEAPTEEASEADETPREIIQYGEPLTYEGQTYKTVIIGKQTWMAENLNYNAEGSRCYNDDEANCKEYGRLYDWATVMALPANCNNGDGECTKLIQPKHRGICPEGWHIPSGSWVENYNAAYAKDYCNSYEVSTDWNIYNKCMKCSVIDEYGIVNFPKGGRFTFDYPDKRFEGIGDDGYWWTSTEADCPDVCEGGHPYAYSSELEEYGKAMTDLLSVRCVKD
jgi:uncharacterized protein (TIGR02145 family)